MQQRMDIETGWSFHTKSRDFYGILESIMRKRTRKSFLACKRGQRKEVNCMMIPTLDQTEGIWIGRTFGQRYHYVQDVFPGDTPGAQWHRANCQHLIARGHLMPEQEGSLS